MGKSVSAYFLAAFVLELIQHPEAFGSQGKSDFRNAAIFRDKASKFHPLNGQVDDDEDVQTTDADGRFKLPRGRGGRLLLTGGIDIRTGLANGFSVVASPASVRNIGTLTALWQALLDRKVKAVSAKKRLGFTEKVTVSQYQAGLVLDSTAGNKPIAKLARQQGYLLQLIRTLATRTESTSHQPLTLSPSAENFKVVVARWLKIMRLLGVVFRLLGRVFVVDGWVRVEVNRLDSLPIAGVAAPALRVP